MLVQRVIKYRIKNERFRFKVQRPKLQRNDEFVVGDPSEFKN